MLADAVLLDIVITNLLDNVHAHAAPDAPVSIRAMDDGDMVRLVVEDGGPGVPEDELGTLFERFRRGPDSGAGIAPWAGHRPERRAWPRRRHVGSGLRRAKPAGWACGHGPPPACAAGPRALSARILLVEDDAATSSAVARNLEAHDFRVTTAADVAGALRAWDAERPDLILLDLGLPDLDGSSVVRHVRREATTPILILSARTDERVKVEALEAGADDYVTKPFGMDELRARIGAVLRRAAGPAADQSGVVRLGPIALDVAERRVTVGDDPVELTPREYELLKVMIAQPGRLLTKGRLLRAVWGTAYADEAHYLHVYVSRLRRKLAAADATGAAGGLITAEPGVGYRIARPGRAALSDV